VLVGFGADFLETWLSPVEYARKFKAMHMLSQRQQGCVHPGQPVPVPDRRQCRPLDRLPARNRGRSDHGTGPHGGEQRNRRVNRNLRNALAKTEVYTPEAVARISGVSVEDQAAVGRQLLAAKRPLVLGTGAGGAGSMQLPRNWPPFFSTWPWTLNFMLFDFNNRHRVEIADRRSTVLEAFDAMDQQSVELVLLNNVNPVFSIPGGSRIAETLGQTKKRFVVAFSNFMDETSATADLVVPVQVALETWDAYESNTATMATLQPTMGKNHPGAALGDLLLNLLPPDRRPAADYQSLVTQAVWPARAIQPPPPG
jgi:hypothetical protein